MDLPPQDPRTAGRPFFSLFRAQSRRFIFLAVVILLNIAATIWLGDLFWRNGLHRAHGPILGIFFILNGLLTLGSFHAFFGAWDILRGGKSAVRITDLIEGQTGPIEKRYAVVMPVYNEDSARFCARIEAIHDSIKATGHLASFDFFILSDTRDFDLWVQEEAAWTNLCRHLDGFGHIYYRRRKINDNRKAGNIGDFVRTWGGRYEGMVVLDADSLMDGGDIVKMVRTMEAYPRLGILQTAPKLIRGASIFTRLQQFAMRLYGPLFIRGLNFWQLGGGSYWGHNALIRVKPFSEFCELPALPGREPFGGKILSHDFVEAALMVSQGWEVWLAWDIQGTYEEAPPTLVDHLKRDRRWCQGNLQHLWLIFARKLPLTVRMHLFMGIMAYLGSPLWFLFLLFGTWLAYDRVISKLSSLPAPAGSINKYLHLHLTAQEQGLTLIVFVFSMLFAPKILAYIGTVFNSKLRKSFGGFIPLTFGVLFETLLSMLLAPCIMVAHTFMVLGIISGQAVGWGSQNRETDGTAWSDAVKFHAAPLILGILWTIVAYNVGITFMAWMSPILLGMLLAVPISVWTSRARYGRAFARVRILSTPEETTLPEVMRLADAAVGSIDPALDPSAPGRHGVVAAVVDPYLNGVHVSLLDPGELSDAEEALAERCLAEGPAAMAKPEMTELMYSAQAMLFMHRGVWLRPADTIHSVWTTAVESYRHRLDGTEMV